MPNDDQVKKLNCKMCGRYMGETTVLARNCDERCHQCAQELQAEMREMHEDSLKYGDHGQFK